MEEKMRRIYSNYTDEEYKAIEAIANKTGMTISAYCKAMVMEKVSGKADYSSANLVKTLHKKLRSLEVDSVFIVSDLYSDEVWSTLSRSEKNTISKQLAKTVRENKDLYIVNEILPGKITQYKKIRM
jgi:hypothetical protein